MDQAHDRPSRLRTLAWMLVIAAASVGFSLGFACATPFAALAAIAAGQLDRRQAVGAVLLAWIGNQAIGYLALGYPRTWDSFAWGGAIGLAALIAAVLAIWVIACSVRPWRLAAAFAAAFLAYEGVLFAASFVLPSEGNAFALSVVGRILAVNLVAYAGLLVLHRLAVGVGLLAPAARRDPALA